MKRLLTQGEVCELIRCSYSTLCRMMNENRFVTPVNGRGRKLIFCSDAVGNWIKARQQQAESTVSSPFPSKQKKQDKERKRRLEAAHIALEKHRQSK